MSSIRRLARALAVTAIAGTMGGAAVLAGQAIAARTRRYAKPDMGLAIRSTAGPGNAPPLRLVLLGDSTALGVGVDRVSDTVGGQLAALLADGPGGRRVELSNVAVSGSVSSDLGTQVARALVGTRPDVAVILVGANDATRFGPSRGAPEHLAAAVRAAEGVPVGLAALTGAVFRADAGTFCPDGFHPSADGYRVWAHALLPAVAEAATMAR